MQRYLKENNQIKDISETWIKIVNIKYIRYRNSVEVVFRNTSVFKWNVKHLFNFLY